jgi:SAM-dependent methyltransferase
MHALDDRDRRLRAIFTEDAELYDRMRPTYPAALFEDLANFGPLGPGSRVLEIGCGTGQATLALAQRGYGVTAIDLGAEMVVIARRRLARFSDVQVLQASFESWPLPEQPFDAVMSATAFHWLDPATRVARAAEALRTGGTLAVITTHHVRGGDTEFFAEAQRCYERWDPSTPPGVRLQSYEEIPADTSELDKSGLFEPVVVQRYTWAQAYTASAYRDLLLTYSGHRALDPAKREGLLDCITELINSRYSGRITKQYMNELYLARRASGRAAARVVPGIAACGTEAGAGEVA